MISGLLVGLIVLNLLMFSFANRGLSYFKQITEEKTSILSFFVYSILIIHSGIIAVLWYNL